MKRFSASNALLKEIKRGKKGGSAKLTFPLTGHITRQLEWPELPEGTRAWSPDDSEFQAQTMELVSNKSLAESISTTIDVTTLGDFAVGALDGDKEAPPQERIPAFQIDRIVGPAHGCPPVGFAPARHRVTGRFQKFSAVHDEAPVSNRHPAMIRVVTSTG